MGIWAECTDDDPWCTAAGGAVGKTLGKWNDDHSWHRWDIESNESGSTAPDKVLRHKWRFSAITGATTGQKALARGRRHTIRCDSAGYFSSFADRLPKACIFDDVIPHLRYSTKDPRITQVARHIRDAQDRPRRPIRFAVAAS